MLSAQSVWKLTRSLSTPHRLLETRKCALNVHSDVTVLARRFSAVLVDPLVSTHEFWIDEVSVQ